MLILTMKIHTFTKVSKRLALTIMAALLAVLVPISAANADSYDDQIKALQNEVSNFQSQAAAIHAQADTLQNQLSSMQATASALQAQIDLNTATVNQLNQQIADTQAKIDAQKDSLSGDLVSLYLDSSVTPIEALASSKSISDFIDKQEYRDTIRQDLQNGISTVTQLKKDLSDKKTSVQQTLNDQSSQKAALAAQETAQANLLAQTQGQEAAYQQIAAQKNAQISTLRAQQAAANLKWGGNVSYSPRGGGYPSFWNDVPMDSTLDNWGMYNRECVSYTAFKVASSGRHMPYWGGSGNAIQWPGNARASGIPVDQNPQAGDVAIWPVGYYGHAMYVEGVSNGNLLISEYNYDWTGRYSERTISASTWQAQGFVFIHFQ